MIVVSNTGPIIAFSKIKKFDILEKLFKEIIIPEKVLEEYNHFKYKAESNIDNSMLRMEKVNQPDSLLSNEVDPGEAEAIALAFEKKADWLILDDRKGRRVAKNIYRLNIIGTAGILLKAKNAGIIKNVTDLFLELKRINYYLSNSLVEEICKKAGE